MAGKSRLDRPAIVFLSYAFYARPALWPGNAQTFTMI